MTKLPLHPSSVAHRVGKKLEWDAAGLKAKNAPEADRLVRKKISPALEPLDLWRFTRRVLF